MNRVSLTLLALLVIAGCGFGPKEMPQTSELAGVYVLSDRSRVFLRDQKSYGTTPESAISLDPDGSVSVRNLPDCYIDGFGLGHGRYVSGRGTWEIEQTDLGFGVTLTIEAGGTLKRGVYHGSSILIKNRQAPFALVVGIGDPDSNEDIVYERQPG